MIEEHGPPADPERPNKPRPKATEKACAYRVMDGANAPESFRQPGELYFYRPDGYVGTVPNDQEAAKKQLEDLCATLRIVFEVDYPDEFGKFFRKTLLTAQAVFDPIGFRPQPLNDLDRFKNEISQVAGGKIKSKYVRRMSISTLVAFIAILTGTLAINGMTIVLKKQGLIMETEPTEDQRAPKPIRHEIPNFFRWEGGYTIGNTGVLLACSMWGLCIAAISRNFEPTFDKLVTPDADLMPPWSRLLFFGITILGLAVILNKRFVTVSIGDIFSTSDISRDAATAALIGLFLGISERALPKELESWAGGFLTKIQNARQTA